MRRRFAITLWIVTVLVTVWVPLQRGGCEGETAGLESVRSTGDARSSAAAEVLGEDAERSGDFLAYEDEAMPKQSISGVLFRLVFSMAAIVALIYGTVYVLRHFARRGSETPSNERMVQVIDRVNLDGRRSVYLVKVVDRLMILGVGTEQVTMLGEIKDESIVESVRSTDFSFHLGRLFNGLHAK